MTIDIWQSLKTTVLNTAGTGMIHECFKSTLIASCIVTVCVMLVILQVYPAKKNLQFNRLIKLAFWITLATSVVMFFHDTIRSAYLEKEFTKRGSSELADSAFAKGGDPAFESTHIEVSSNHVDEDETIRSNPDVGKAISELDSIIYKP